MPASEKHVALVIGASRGIGRQIAITFANAGYAVVVSSKSTTTTTTATAASFPPDPNSPQSTITTVAREICDAGGTAHAIPVDTRSEPSVTSLIRQTLELHGHIDALIYNSGAIWWSSVAGTPYKRYKLMQAVNLDGFYAAIQAILPHFAARKRGRIVAVCPPIYSRFFAGKAAYATSKVGMSVLVKGLAVDFTRANAQDTAVTGIWPASAIQSAATRDAESENPSDLRSADVFADAILAIVRADPRLTNGLLTTDEDFLREHCGVADFARYSLVPGAVPRRIMPAHFPDLTVAEQNDEGKRVDSVEIRKRRGAKI